jgi:hypothetical protein
MLVNTLDVDSRNLLNPLDRFIDAHLSLFVSESRRSRTPGGIMLFNEKYQDGHFSAIGSKVWAEAVAERIALLIRRGHAAVQ